MEGEEEDTQSASTVEKDGVIEEDREKDLSPEN